MTTQTMEFEVDEQETTTRQDSAREYLEEHRIPELLENLVAALVYHRPDNHREFMLKHIENLKKAKEDFQDPPCMFDISNIQSVYGMLDITKRGHITMEQYKEAMKCMGVSKYNTGPAGAELNKITQETFVRELKTSLKDAVSTYQS